MSKNYVNLQALSTFLSNCKNIFANISHTHTKDDISDFPASVSQFDNDVGYITLSDIPNVIVAEEWEFTLVDDGVVTKSIATTNSIATEELVFVLKDGSTVNKKVVINL